MLLSLVLAVSSLLCLQSLAAEEGKYSTSSSYNECNHSVVYSLCLLSSIVKLKLLFLAQSCSFGPCNTLVNSTCVI